MNRAFAWPVGSGSGRYTRWGVLSSFVLTSALGGITMGIAVAAGALWVRGSTLRPQLSTGLLMLMLYASMAELLGRMGGLPQRERQVRRERLARSTWGAALAFGFGLGLGGWTHMAHASSYTLLAAALYSGRPSVGVLMGLAFGTARGLVPLGHALFLKEESRATRVEGKVASKKTARTAHFSLGGLGLLVSLLYVM